MNAEHFWNFSIKVYEPLAATFLCLQNQLELDVNLLLFCCWLGGKRRILADNEFLVLIEKVAPFRNQLIRPLREARRFVKKIEGISNSEDLKNKILVVELEAERTEQIILLKTLNAFDLLYPSHDYNEAESTMLNFQSYLAAATVQATEDANVALTKIIGTIFLQE
jgi:uncharacterized protein (TIGR02444 family)